MERINFLKKIKRLSVALSCLAGVLAFGQATAEEYPKMNLKLAHAFPQVWVQSQKVDQWFVDEIERRSGGNIKIQIYWSGALAAPKYIFNIAGSGGVEMGASSPGYYPSDMPFGGLINALSGTLSFDNAKEGALITQEIFDKFPIVQEDWKKMGVWPLYFNALGEYRLACTSPLKSADDLKNKKIRQFSDFHPKLWESVGATGITVLPAEIYEGLARGRMDCGYYDYSLLSRSKLYEPAKYLSNINLGASSTWPVVVNYDLFFNKWPQNVRDLFMEVGREAAAKSIEIVQQDEDDALKEMLDKGAIMVEFPEAEQKKVEAMVPDFLDIWTTNMGQKGLGKEAAEISDYIKERRTELRGK